MRGEKKVILQPEHLRTGSPPRARGKVQQLHPAVRDMGITPACAGKSRWKICPGVKWWDHPRVRGEKSTVYSMGRPGMGSPPRARGKALVVLQAGQHAGITPACAGKSRRLHSPSAKRRDHPRVRGEKCAEWRERARKIGSPPRARGKDRLSRRSPRLAGITPACAGKSMRKFGVLGLLLGSPPRARGKGVLSSFELLNKGITPACAGKSVCFLLFDR